jgi:hypothetical protein
MPEAKIERALGAGLIATGAMQALMYIGGGIGLPIWNIAGITGAAMAFGKNISRADPLWIWGVGIDLILTIVVLPLCYAHWVFSELRGPEWFRGLQWNWFFWFLQQMLMMPLLGKGVFDRLGSNSAFEIVSWLVLWSVYGLIFGLLAGPQRVWRSYLQEHPEHLHEWPH